MSNTNENATVPISQNFLKLNKALAFPLEMGRSGAVAHLRVRYAGLPRAAQAGDSHAGLPRATPAAALVSRVASRRPSTAGPVSHPGAKLEQIRGGCLSLIVIKIKSIIMVKICF